MEKFKTLNNHLCRQIINSASVGNYRAVYMQIFNSREMMTDELFVRVYNICYELAPMTLQVYKTLPNDVKAYYNNLWLTNNNDNHAKPKTKTKSH